MKESAKRWNLRRKNMKGWRTVYVQEQSGNVTHKVDRDKRKGKKRNRENLSFQFPLMPYGKNEITREREKEKET